MCVRKLETISDKLKLFLLCLLLLQLLGKTRAMNITASGTGFALVQVTSRYNLNVTGAFPLFTLDPQVDQISTNDHLQLSICSGYDFIISLFTFQFKEIKKKYRPGILLYLFIFLYILN